MGDMLNKLKTLLETEEGMRLAEEYFGSINNAKKRSKQRVKKLNDFIKSLSDEDIHHLMIKYCKWEEIQQDRLYHKGIDGCSNLMELIFDYFRKYGKSLKPKDTFQSEKYRYKNYEMSLYSGQGYFYKIEYIQKTRLI